MNSLYNTALKQSHALQRDLDSKQLCSSFYFFFKVPNFFYLEFQSGLDASAGLQGTFYFLL